MTQQPPQPPLNVKKFAHAIHRSERTVWRMVAARQIRVNRPSPGKLEIPPTEVDRLLREGVAS